MNLSKELLVNNPQADTPNGIIIIKIAIKIAVIISVVFIWPYSAKNTVIAGEH
jgi:hypothetical protein